MAVVKVKNKEKIDHLQAVLTVKLGRKITQQDILDLCVQLGSQNIDQLIQLAETRPVLTPEIADQIIQEFEQFAGTPYDPAAICDSDVDNDAYL